MQHSDIPNQLINVFNVAVKHGILDPKDLYYLGVNCQDDFKCVIDRIYSYACHDKGFNPEGYESVAMARREFYISTRD